MFRNTIPKLCYCFLLILLMQQAVAGTYYISTNGSDFNGNGSIGSPWRSLYHATNVVKNAGDIIHVTAGVYTETVQCELAVGVSIEGEGMNSVLKSIVTTEWKALLTANSPEGTNGNQHIAHLKFDGQNLATFWAIYVGGRSNVSIHDCSIVDFNDRGVIFEGRSGGYNTEPKVYATGNTFYNNTVNNCAAYNTALGMYGRGCLNIGGQSGMLIYNNVITQNSRPEGYNGWPIKGYDNGYLKGCKIYNNTLTKIPLGNTNGVSGWDFAIELFNESGLEIYNNIITGSIDLNRQSKGDYAYSVYIHDNTIGHNKLQKILENGIILEYGTEHAIIEKNRITNVGVPFYFTPREGSIVEEITIKDNRCENIGVAGGRHEGFAVRFGEEGKNLYYLENFFIYNNTFTGSAVEKPYWGLSVLGVAKANNIKVVHNSFSNFSAGYITANPAYSIDTMIVENNSLSGNGYGNKAAFVSGEPAHYIVKHNTATNGVVFSFTNIKMNIIRPLYYETKSAGMLELVGIFAGIFCIVFGRKENIYVFPLGLIALGIYAFLNIDEELWGMLVLNGCFIGMSIYGWLQWNKRDKKKHRIIRVTSSSLQERKQQLVFFIAGYVILLGCMLFCKNIFGRGIIAWADALASAAALNGMWLLTKKKAESWYWWIIACALSIPLYFFKHYTFASACHVVLLVLLIAGVFAWQKRKNRKRRRYSSITQTNQQQSVAN